MNYRPEMTVRDEAYVSRQKLLCEIAWAVDEPLDRYHQFVSPVYRSRLYDDFKDLVWWEEYRQWRDIGLL